MSDHPFTSGKCPECRRLLVEDPPKVRMTRRWITRWLAQPMPTRLVWLALAGLMITVTIGEGWLAFYCGWFAARTIMQK